MKNINGFEHVSVGYYKRQLKNGKAEFMQDQAQTHKTFPLKMAAQGKNVVKPLDWEFSA